MTNADKFKNIFGLYATELWSMPGKDFLEWLNSEAMNCSEIPNNSDAISRQAAIEALADMHCKSDEDGYVWIIRSDAWARIDALPSAQPETHDKRAEMHACDLISRAEAIDATWFEPSYTDPLNVLTEVRDRLKALPSAQPAPEEFEWCRDCKEYDQDAHCCHRWNKAIRNTVAELEKTWPKQRWIPVTERLPKDFEDVLVWYEYFRFGEYNRMVQTCDVGYYISEFNRWGGGVTGQKVRAIAWMPLPEPYREDDHETD